MGVLTELSLEDAGGLCERWGVALRTLAPVAAGSVNSSFALDGTDGARWFLRVYEEQGVDGARREAAMLAHLAARGVPTPFPRALRDVPGTYVQLHRDKPAVLFPWVPGTMACQRSVTAGRAFAVGQALARVHRAGEGLVGLQPSRFGPEALRLRLEALRGVDLTRELRGVVDGLLARIEALDPRTTPRDQGLIHGDLFRDNVLWEGDALTALLDFESASLGSFVFDLLVTVLAWCYGDALDLALARRMVEGYRAERALSAREVAELPEAARRAALRFTVTRVTDFELRRGAGGVYKDYRRFLGRLQALEALGSPRLLEGLGLS
ncbi:MAG: homoserine kinase [Deltaproteobacteria bacterium]|nr:homoserine kinase [Deltaproteobacteria bacterium]